jgi:membrane-bound serine protease (ClpP class)
MTRSNPWIRRFSIAAALAGAWLLVPGAPAQAPSAAPVFRIEIKGAIGVATDLHIKATLERAAQERAALVVVALDTPGGLVSSTREIIQAILKSPVPVAIYVAPLGAHAASAGTYIAYAAHLSAMAPGTSLGAATPVSLGGIPTPPREPARRGSEREPDPAPGAMERKIVNDAVGLIKSLAELRGRNVEWAEKAVRDAATMTAEEAVKARVVDILAQDLQDLLRQAEGRRVRMETGERTLALAGAPIVEIETNWRLKLMQALADPTVAYLLLLAGIFGILFEFQHPGVFFPGVIGGIALLLALGGLAVLPLNFAGLALLLLGIALMTAEAFTPGVGALGIGGLVAFAIGSVFLFDPSEADIDLRVAWPAVAGATAMSGFLFMFVIGLAVRARRRPVVAGAEWMIGRQARVVAWAGDKGSVRVDGEVWQAVAAEPLAAGAAVRVLEREGLRLKVGPA